MSQSVAAAAKINPLTEANKQAAKQAGLHYVMDGDPGIKRVKISSGFAYVGRNGKRLRDAKTLERIKSLVIPPGWHEVWICADPKGHIQATARDARGRKQYRYHPRWREARDETKYHKLIDFAQALPKIRRTVKRHLAKHGLPREKVLAAVISITEKTLIRVGNEEYANHNDSYGLTTLHDRHAKLSGRKVRFEFRGKSGVEHEIDLEDARLAEIVRKCRDLPGEELFQYLDEKNNVRDVTSTDVNAYLREISGGDFTAKDFRTWAGTVLAARALQEFEKFDSQTQAKKNVVQAIERVATRLGNTRSVCRKCYIHPDIIGTYLDGTLLKHLTARAGRMLTKSINHLPPEEAAVLALLGRSMAAG